LEIENTVKQIAEEVIMLEQYAKSEIVIIVHILETDG
jgi:ribonuclease PH